MKEFHCIFNNKGNGKQTGNIGFTANGSKVEKWVTGEQEETVIEDTGTGRMEGIYKQRTGKTGYKSTESGCT